MGSVKYRSRFEEYVADVLPTRTKYEAKTFRFPVKCPTYRCNGCGSKDVVRTTSYKPDFLLPNGTFIEAKGIFTAGNRRNLLAWKAHFPEETLRIVFQADNTFSKKSTTRYSDWAKAAGFEYCVGFRNIPKEWTK